MIQLRISFRRYAACERSGKMRLGWWQAVANQFYDELGAGYDAIINWPERLRREAPFFEHLFAKSNVASVLDTACGTGEHAALFASWGLEVVATDISDEMLSACRRKYGDEPVTWVKAGFGETFEVLGRTFDAVTCLGHSFPHILTDDAATRTVKDFALLLRPAGVLVVQQMNFEAMRIRGTRFMGPQSQIVDGEEQLLLRIFDLDRDPVRFTMLRMAREDDKWALDAWETTQRAWSLLEMDGLIRDAGFASVESYGNFAGKPFKAENSDQMIIVAVRRMTPV